MALGDGGVFYDVFDVVWDDETGRQEAQVRCICLGRRDRLTRQLFNIMDIMFVGASAGATEDIIPPPLCYIAEKTAVKFQSDAYPIAA